jgi:hypothetical protein
MGYEIIPEIKDESGCLNHLKQAIQGKADLCVHNLTNRDLWMTLTPVQNGYEKKKIECGIHAGLDGAQKFTSICIEALNHA